MSYKIINPTDVELKIQHLGTIYKCPANGERPNTPDDTAEFWKVHVHQFIQIQKETGTVSNTTEEIIENAPIVKVTEDELNDIIENSELIEDVDLDETIKDSETVEVIEIIEEPKTKKSTRKTKIK